LADRGVQPRLHQITIDDWDGSVFQQQPFLTTLRDLHPPFTPETPVNQ
jgi:hypothetical protein